MNNKIISIDTLKYYNDKISNYVDEKVSDAVDNLELDDLNAILVDTDSVADDPSVPDYVTETELNAALSSKMDKVTLAKVATSGSYNDLSNKPTIPAAVTENTVSGWGFTKNTGTYSKPSGGIPKSDLASAVQTSLGKADTAIQSHQDISGKQDKLVSGTNIKTINGTSILGSGDITISGGGSSSGGSGAYAEVNHGTSDTTFALTPNTFHVWDEVASLTLDFGSETIGVANEYLFQFTSGATATSLTLPDDIKWTEELTIEPNRIYQVSILKGLASVLSWSDSTEIKDNFIDIQGNELVFQYPTTSELSIDVYGRTTGMPSSHEIVVPSGSSSYVASNLSTILYINSVSPSSDSIYNYTFQLS